MKTFQVGGIGCGSCVVQINRAIQRWDDEAVVHVDRQQGRVTINSMLPAAQLMAALRAAGFPATEVQEG